MVIYSYLFTFSSFISFCFLFALIYIVYINRVLGYSYEKPMRRAAAMLAYFATCQTLLILLVKTETVREKQTTFLQTYARMAAANTGAAKKESTGAKLVELRVFKEDKSPVTRMDQWKIQFNMSKCILTATRQGVDPATLWHRGTMLTTHHVVVFTNDQSAGFYKTEIGKMEGLQSFLPEEWPRANSIYCTLPGAAECITTEIGAHFAASTLGGIKENQVRIPRKPWQPAGPNTNFKVHLEVDDAAFQWLKQRNWTSYMGLYMVRWEHLPVRGVEGYIAPDQNIEELLKTNIPAGNKVGAKQAPNHRISPGRDKLQVKARPQPKRRKKRLDF